MLFSGQNHSKAEMQFCFKPLQTFKKQLHYTILASKADDLWMIEIQRVIQLICKSQLLFLSFDVKHAEKVWDSPPAVKHVLHHIVGSKFNYLQLELRLQYGTHPQPQSTFCVTLSDLNSIIYNWNLDCRSAFQLLRPSATLKCISKMKQFTYTIKNLILQKIAFVLPHIHAKSKKNRIKSGNASGRGIRAPM
ncbi:MAG: hypothetical protein EZS28_023553 [Streblomastix strix]|uniref:Uncharacterized protein n=1 Tax=Streblomastix strix TaxID=222440 RepID=A0A5J4VEP1_9EUKA|nr:MAG: hypothetical protein EZS28_023553 [Streblomastix strix]